MKILRINHSSEDSHVFDIYYFDMINFQEMHIQNYEKIVGFNQDRETFTQDWEPEIYDWIWMEITFSLNSENKSISGVCPKLVISDVERFILNNEVKFFTLNLRCNGDHISEMFEDKNK